MNEERKQDGMFHGSYLRAQVNSHIVFGPLSRHFPVMYLLLLYAIINLVFSAELFHSIIVFGVATYCIHTMTCYEQAVLGWEILKVVSGIASFIGLLGSVVWLARGEVDVFLFILAFSVIWFPSIELHNKMIPHQKYVSVARLLLTIPLLVSAVMVYGDFDTEETDAKLPVENEEELEIEELERRAEKVLEMSNTSARRKIDVVFRYIDELVESEEDGQAEVFIEQALRHAPWRLNYQMLYAELLERSNKKEKAAEKVRQVLNYSETDALIDRARELLGKEPLPEIKKDDLSALADDDYSIILVPMIEYDRWLLFRLKKELSEKLGIPVYVRKVSADYPGSDRDQRDIVIDRFRVPEVVIMFEPP